MNGEEEDGEFFLTEGSACVLKEEDDGFLGCVWLNGEEEDGGFHIMQHMFSVFSLRA